MKSTKPEWRATSVQGLYEYRGKNLKPSQNGTYYARFRVKGRRTFESLKTTVFEHAKIKHRKRILDVEKDRQRAGDVECDFRTLGALAAEAEARWRATTVSESTVIGRRNGLVRLKSHWRRGNFDTFFARNVDADVISELCGYRSGRDSCDGISSSATLLKIPAA